MDLDGHMNTATNTDAKCKDATNEDQDLYMFLKLKGNLEISKSAFHQM